MKLAAAVLVLAVTGAPAQWLDGSRDVVLRRAFLPSERNVHGEFREVRRGEATCAQTLLYTSALRRAVQRFTRKERASWPEGDSGHDDSQVYIGALEQAKTEVLARFDARVDRDDPKQKMLIEFVLAPDAAFFAIYAPELAGEADDLRIAAKEPLVVREVSRAYAGEEIRRMTESAFRGDADADED